MPRLSLHNNVQSHFAIILKQVCLSRAQRTIDDARESTAPRIALLPETGKGFFFMLGEFKVSGTNGTAVRF
jgi:hypothetical protein